MFVIIILLWLRAFALAHPNQGPDALTSRTMEVSTFNNPVLYEDFADNDISLGPDGKYYYSASNMHYSPGAPILRSADLVNWKLIGHSVPFLNFGAQYNMTGGTDYTGGTWASTMRYRKSNGLWYWIGCVNFWVTYIYTASDVTGLWVQSAALYGTCYYDCGLLIDDDDTMYVVHGNTNVNMSQLAPDGLSEVSTQQIYTTPSGFSGVEGNRMYKRNGTYYILDDAPGNGATFIWKSSSPWGPWTSKLLQNGIAGPVGGAGSPCQGSLIETPEGAWYFMSFVWAYPAGRMPVLAPITWGSDAYPVLTEVDGAWGVSYPKPLPTVPTPSWLGSDDFNESALGVEWEFNHNPDPTFYKLDNGLTLSTVTVTTDLYLARNTLTHRLHGPYPVGTLHLDFTNMADGDRTGLAAFRDNSSYIGIFRAGNTYTLELVTNLSQNSSANWATISNGTVIASTTLFNTKEIYLRTNIDARGNGTHLAEFYYSLNGKAYTQLGPSTTLDSDWNYFMGYRYAIFNFATKALGGSVLVKCFSWA